MDQIERKLSGEVVFDGKIMRIERDCVSLGNGKTSFREVLRHNGGAGVLFVRDGKALLVRQYRYVYGRSLYEIPAGKLDRGEDPRLAALRELEEETGYTAKDATLLATLYPSPGYTDEIISVYLVTDAVAGEMHPDEGENVDAVWMPLDTLGKKIACGEICDAKTVIAYLQYTAKTRD